jgi:hypothetical protein
MRFVLAALAFLFNAADNFTTYLCLRSPVEGFEIYEANPLAKWGFDRVGVGTGLWIETVLCAAAIAFLVYSKMFQLRTRIALLAVLAALPAGAALNNLLVMRELQISLF